MIKRDILRDLIKSYYPEGNEQQITIMCSEVERELGVLVHAKVRELVNHERMNEWDNSNRTRLNC